MTHFSEESSISGLFGGFCKGPPGTHAQTRGTQGTPPGEGSQKKCWGGHCPTAPPRGGLKKVPDPHWGSFLGCATHTRSSPSMRLRRALGGGGLRHLEANEPPFLLRKRRRPPISNLGSDTMGTVVRACRTGRSRDRRWTTSSGQEGASWQMARAAPVYGGPDQGREGQTARGTSGW